MTRFSRLVLASSLLAPFSLSEAASLEQVLAAMNKSAPSFRDMSARLTRVEHTAVINDTSRAAGVVRMKRTGKEVRLLIEFTEPDPVTVAFEKATARRYYPKIQTVQVFDLGKHRSLVDQFLLLGFGTSGVELARSYAIKAGGEESVGGAATTRLELLPKTAGVKEHLSRAELWVTAEGYPLQQKFYFPSGDYTLVTYQELRLNADLPDAAFRLSLPKGVKIEYPQK
ncbi:MAG: outer membrane lipoprotein carrier protein LolA [Bryobacterales bacterium]|nr:outer membrane lipoprotein carrier protein LolA [Bryobacterales bacterium]